ncbi:MAG TPA: hypothetical protein VMF65_22990 [Acidimicrobiales bacterium]|nr:hypothetical protein [Acidimicrobiales bacterium]
MSSPSTSPGYINGVVSGGGAKGQLLTLVIGGGGHDLQSIR